MVDYAALEAIRDAMKEASLEIPDKARRTAVAYGDDGLAWLAGLARLVAELEREWNLSVGRTFSQGTEAFVAETVMVDGRKAC
jgi:streptomycin 6-kinase